MRTEEPREFDPLVDMGYETRDINPVGIGRVMFGFVAFGVVSFVIAALIYSFIIVPGLEKSNEPRAKRPMPAPPNPLLQTGTSAKVDIMDMRQHETAVLTGTAWVDRQKGIVRIPIEAAMAEISAGKGMVAQDRIPAVVPGRQVSPALGQVVNKRTLDARAQQAKERQTGMMP